MNNDYYLAPKRHLWKGRCDEPFARFYQIVELINLSNLVALEEKKFVFLGFASDEGVRRNFGRIGAKDAPDILKKHLASLPTNLSKCFDAGTICCFDRQLEKAQEALGQAVEALIQKNYFPIVLGGGHETAWGHYQGIRSAMPTEDIAIVNFDAHFDLRPLIKENQGSSGTSFYQIAIDSQNRGVDFSYYCLGIQEIANTVSLFQKAQELDCKFLFAEDFFYNSKKVDLFVDHLIEKHENIYITFDLDVFGASYAPGLSAPQSMGLQPWQVINPLRKLFQSNKVIALDVVEYNPKYDFDSKTARLAATLIGQCLLSSTSTIKEGYALGTSLDR